MRRASVLRECGRADLESHAAIDAAQPALWLLDGLWRASSPLVAASKCIELLQPPHFSFGAPPLGAQHVFSQERLGDGSGLCIALAAAAPVCERLRSIGSKGASQAVQTLLDQLLALRAAVVNPPSCVWEGVGEYRLRSVELASHALDYLQAHIFRKLPPPSTTPS